MTLIGIYELCRIFCVMNESKKEQTCLRVTKVTRNRLAELGTKNQTFEQIVTELLDKQNESSGESFDK